jgi:hypothetical protein
MCVSCLDCSVYLQFFNLNLFPILIIKLISSLLSIGHYRSFPSAVAILFMLVIQKSHADIPWNPSALLQQNNSISRKQILTMYFKIILIELMYISILFSCLLIGQGGLLLTRKLLSQGFPVYKLKSLLQRFYGRHNDLVTRYGILLPQMTTDMFRSTKIQSELGCPGRVSSSCPSTGTRRFTFVASLMNEEKPGLRLRQTEHIRGHLDYPFGTCIIIFKFFL